MSQKSKAIKRLEKQLKRMNVRVKMMGELYLERGPFGAVLRTNYLNGTDESTVDGFLAKTDIGIDITMGAHDILGSWRVHDKVHLLTACNRTHQMVLTEIQCTLIPRT